MVCLVWNKLGSGLAILQSIICSLITLYTNKKKRLYCAHIHTETRQNLDDDDIGKYLSLFSLLYADDTILMAENPHDLQLALNAVYTYCKLWRLTVNATKTKVVIFSRGKIRNKASFEYGGQPLEVVDQ